MAIQLSEQQKAIVNATAEHEKHVCVVARAGCGKTTVVLESCQVAKRNVLLCAFNKSIAQDMASKAPADTDPKTLHSLGFGGLRMSLGRVTLDQDKSYYILEQLDKSMTGQYPVIRKLVGLVKNNLVDPTDANLEDLAMEYDVQVESDEATRIYPLVRAIVQRSIPRRGDRNIMIDFDDMIWLPVVMDLKNMPKYDTVFVDEAQDLNVCQMKLLQMVSRGQIVYVGDPAQAIYAFRGADSRAMATFGDMLRAGGRDVITLPLNQTRRCPKAMVKLAQKYVPDIEALPDAPEGSVRTVSRGEVAAMPGDMIICRVNADLMPEAFALMRAGISCKVQGKDLGANLVKIIKARRAISIDDLMNKLRAFEEKEIGSIQRRYGDKPSKLETAMQLLNDKLETIYYLASNETSVKGLIETIEKLFSDVQNTSGIVLLSTIHKAKGLEAPRVWWLQMKKEFKGEQENNIKYVAITRAKSELVLVSP